MSCSACEGLAGREAECRSLRALVSAVTNGESRALVLHGEAGVGKTALLDYLAQNAADCRVERTAGAQSEMELAFAVLHQLCAPMLDHLDAIPIPQRDALRIAFGLSAGPPPDRFLVGLGVLSLLSGVAERQPLVCLIDDGQWLDRTSAQVLAFVARRLGAESVGLVFAARAVSSDLAGLPELAIGGLSAAHARALLGAVLAGPVDARVRDQILAETRGNPLAILELPQGRPPADLAGGFGLPVAVPIEGRLEESFRRRLAQLPRQTRRLLVLAAADPTGDAALVWRAAASLGIPAAASGAAADAGLAEFAAGVRFRHPLVRSAAYQLGSAGERQAAHRALADATDLRLDPDRRAWHRAQAAAGPDEDVAAQLEQSADRARARGGLAAAAAFLERAATLTLGPGLRADRALAAAEAKLQAGAFDSVRDLVAMAGAGLLTDSQQATSDLILGRLAYLTNRGSEAPTLLLAAARRLETIDADLCRATYLDALSAAVFAGRLASPGCGVVEVARAAGAAPRPVRAPRGPDFLLQGLATEVSDGLAAAVPMMRTALATFGSGMSVGEELRWFYMTCVGALRIWDDKQWDALSSRHVQLARDAGALSDLPAALTSRAYLLLFSGELSAVSALADEAQTVNDATGGHLAPYIALGLAALSGDEKRTLALLDTAHEDIARRGEGVGITIAEWAHAALCNGLGRYPEAVAAAQYALSYDADPGSMIWPMVELVEAATRTGQTELADSACGWFSEQAAASGTDWSLGLRARSQALVSDDDAAEPRYAESIERLSATRMRVDLARAHLLYGEWLRRQRRRLDAREQLRTAHDMFQAMGVGAFAGRSRRELRATGETARKRVPATPSAELTAQEAQIAQLALQGLSNPQIGTRLFISAHTVQYHLRKVFAKLGISSRSQLDRVLGDSPATFGQPR